jgi:hypothetical protein
VVVALAEVAGVVLAEPTALAAGTSRVAAGETAMLSEAVPEDSADRARGAAVAVAPPASRLEAAEVSVAAAGVAAAVGADKTAQIRRPSDQEHNHRSTDMKTTSPKASLFRRLGTLCVVAGACVSTLAYLGAQTAKKAAPPAAAAPSVATKLFDTPEKAADALVAAATDFNVPALTEIFGPDGEDIVFSGEFAQDKKHATDFAGEAREKKSVSVDPKTGTRAFLLVGNEDWPFPVPLVKRGEKWFFDSKAGRQELLYRRIGDNELDAIEICRGYVEAQQEYAVEQRNLYDVNQYAQRIVSTPGKQDGLAWQNGDGTWGGPIGQNIARAIEQGYTSSAEPYHGYFFKILKGQGPAAPLGEMDYVVKNLMIGGFALVAAPAEYNVTGVRSFIVSNDGVVFEKDLGPTTLDQFEKMDRFNPDKSWSPVLESE